MSITSAPERLRRLFEPRSVAVVGASSDPSRIGGRPLTYLADAGFAGEIFPVNPNHAAIAGRRSFASVEDVEADVDLALILVPAAQVLAAMESCARKGVRSAVIFGAGFAEVGEEGKHQQEAIRAVARDAGMSVLGPNCLGAANVPGGVMATFAANLGYGRPLPGTVAVASQSGAVGSHCMELMRARGIGLSKWVTTGNEMDIDLSECVAYLASDPATRVILGYIEGVRDGDRFQAALREADRAGKPVVMLKAGSSEVGAAATQSHTDALAGSDAVYQAVFDRYGVHRATSIDDLFNRAYTLASPVAPPAGDAVAVVSLGRAFEQQIEFSARRRGIPVAIVDQPPTGGIADRFVGGVRDELEGSGSSTVLAFVGSAVTAPEDGPIDELVALGGVAPDRCRAVVGLVSPEDRRRLEGAGYLVFDNPEAALVSIATAARHARRPTPGRADRAGRGSAAPARAAGPVSWSGLVHPGMTEIDAHAVLDRLGVATVPHHLAADPDEAVAAAERLGYPVVVKIVSPAIAHKSDIGAVVVGLEDAGSVGRAARDVWARSERAVGRDHLAGLLVAPMVSGGVELILGMRRDPVFGPVIVVGAGGEMVEVFGDVSVRIPPIGEDEAAAMVAELSTFDLLRAGLHDPDAHLGQLASVVARFSRLVPDLADHADSVEVNPLLIGSSIAGPVALDALVVPRAATTAPPAASLVGIAGSRTQEAP